MTWLMDNQRPLKVTALTQTDKPQIYTHVERRKQPCCSEYPKGAGHRSGVVELARGRKDSKVYGATGYAIATGRR